MDWGRVVGADSVSQKWCSRMECIFCTFTKPMCGEHNIDWILLKKRNLKCHRDVAHISCYNIQTYIFAGLPPCNQTTGIFILGEIFTFALNRPYLASPPSKSHNGSQESLPVLTRMTGTVP